MIVKVCEVPEQLTDPLVKVGVTVMLAVIGKVPLLVAVKDGIPVTLPMLAVGGQGVISVASNVVPREVTALVQAALEGDFGRAGQAHARLFPLFKDLLTLDTNPVPIKAALALTGQIVEAYRLPLVPLTAASKAQLRQTLVSLGLVK